MLGISIVVGERRQYFLNERRRLQWIMTQKHALVEINFKTFINKGLDNIAVSSKHLCNHG